MDKATEKGLALITLANECYSRLEGFREERERNKRYNYGDQWSDVIEVDGRRVTEEQYIKEQGSIPLKNNLIRRLVRNVIGIYASQTDEAICMARDPAEKRQCECMTQLLRYNMQLNRSKALYTRSMEEFLISGMVIHKKTYGVRDGRTDCWTDYVQPNNFFVDARMHDFRGWDCDCLGEIHHVTFAETVRKMSTCEEDVERLRRIFSATDDSTPCRITELWRRENRPTYLCHDTETGTMYTVSAGRKPQMETENAARAAAGRKPVVMHWQIAEVWRYYFLSPSGDILAEGDSPYAHGSHPYVFKAYPMIDGEVHSFVADVIDQQRYTNRLITLYDWIMRASSKGVLLVPEDCIPAGCSPQDFADAWSRYNGVVFYKPSLNGAVPQQIANNSTNIGIRELLDVQLRFFEDISGVNSALQGKASNVAISAELYGQQTQNATTTLLDILDTFNEFVRDCAYKDMKNIQQYYTPERICQIAGADTSISALQDVEFDISMSPSLSTPSLRQSNNALLMEIWRSGQITLEQMLRAGSFPFADSLLG